MKTIQNCFAHCGFKHSDLEMPNKADSENDTLEMHHVKRFHASTIVFNVTIKMKTVQKQLLKELQQNTKSSVDQETDDDKTKCEQVTNQDARKFIAEL
jgi:hypothetical protein